MKKILTIIFGLMMMLSFSSCEVYTHATTQDDIYVEAEADVVRSNVDFNVVIRYGTPYYYEGSLLYYLYNGLYYYPFYYDNYWYVRAYRHPFAHIYHRPHFRPHRYDYRFRPNHHPGFGNNGHINRPHHPGGPHRPDVRPGGNRPHRPDVRPGDNKPHRPNGDHGRPGERPGMNPNNGNGHHSNGGHVGDRPRTPRSQQPHMNNGQRPSRPSSGNRGGSFGNRPSQSHSSGHVSSPSRGGGHRGGFGGRR
jgi:hypothetical protein